MPDQPDEIPAEDPWDTRAAYLAEGHDEPEFEYEVVVDAESGDEPDLSEHESSDG